MIFGLLRTAIDTSLLGRALTSLLARALHRQRALQDREVREDLGIAGFLLHFFGGVFGISDPWLLGRRRRFDPCALKERAASARERLLSSEETGPASRGRESIVAPAIAATAGSDRRTV